MENETKQSSREFWEGVLKEDRLDMKKIGELRDYIGDREEYKIFLNLIGRDLMFADMNGINVDEDYEYLQCLRKECY